MAEEHRAFRTEPEGDDITVVVLEPAQKAQHVAGRRPGDGPRESVPEGRAETEWRPYIVLLSLKAYPSLGGALGFSMVAVGFFVFLHRLPENRVDFLEMLDAFTEFSRFSHQHSVASLQFLKAQAQRFLLVAPARGMGRAMAALPLKLFDRRVKHLAVFEQMQTPLRSAAPPVVVCRCAGQDGRTRTRCALSWYSIRTAHPGSGQDQESLASGRSW